MKIMNPITELPETCPTPGCHGTREDMTTAVDVTIYNGRHIERNVDFQPAQPPEDANVRCWCSWCTTYFELSEDFADSLIVQTCDALPVERAPFEPACH